MQLVTGGLLTIPARVPVRESTGCRKGPRLEIRRGLRRLSLGELGIGLLLRRRSGCSDGNFTTGRNRLGNVGKDILAHKDVLGFRNVQGRHLLQESRKLVTSHSVNCNKAAQRGLVQGLERIENLLAVLAARAVEQHGLISRHLGRRTVKKRKYKNEEQTRVMENVKTSLDGYRLDFEIKNVPVAFVNALRRILLSEIPTVMVQNVMIRENTSQLIHEMLRHRVEMLPVAVRPEELDVIRDTKISIRVMPSEAAQVLMSTDFTVQGPRTDILLKDRDLGTPLYFLKMNPRESLWIEATLGTDPRGASQVCVATYAYHIDQTLAKLQRDRVLAENTDLAAFDNHDVQRCWSRDPSGRPNWFDFSIESIGVIKAGDLLKRAVKILQEKIENLAKVEPIKEDDGSFGLVMPTESHTLGALVQSILYSSGPPKLVDDVRFTVGHPLQPSMHVRFWSATPPKEVLARCVKEALALCESILRSV